MNPKQKKQIKNKILINIITNFLTHLNMKIKNLLLFAAAATLSLSAFADTEGEYAVDASGNPAMVGRATADHLFVYGDVDEAVRENIISFKAGTPQTVGLYLNDDEIYTLEDVQALTPIAYNAAGDLYNEITYNSFQCDIYVPEGLSIIPNDDDLMCSGGDRLPSSSSASIGLYTNPDKEIDGVNYKAYLVLVIPSATQAYGTHLSARSASKYKNNGALKTYDAPVLYFNLENDNSYTGHTNDLIVANMVLNVRECDIAGWEVNSKQFFYGEGGNNENQRFQKYNRVKVYGSDSVIENMTEKTVDNVKYYNVAGMESAEPFDGVNVKVVTYTDGTTNTSKVIK